MATFPKAEAKILKLARVVIDGLRAASEDFPNMPVSPDELQHLLDEVEADLIAVTAAKAAYHECHKRKDRSLYQLKRALKAVLAIAEVAARRHPERLTGLGWGPRREPRPLQPPGEVRNIKIEAQGETYVLLSWKPPVDGGAVAAYQIQGKRGGSPWKDVHVCTTLYRLLGGQPRGVDLEYRVVARNKAGMGNPSATVTCVL